MRLRDFGFTDGINEVIAVTINEDGSLNTAPVGIIVDDADGVKARVRLYKSHTRENIRRGSDLFANIVKDAQIFVLSAFEDLGHEYFDSVSPPVLRNALAWCRFVAELRGSHAYLEIVDGSVLRGEVRPVNRGFNAVIEALVHATRFVVFKDEEIRDELRRRILYYGEIVEKCGSKAEKEAYKMILERTGLGKNFSGAART